MTKFFTTGEKLYMEVNGKFFLISDQSKAIGGFWEVEKIPENAETLEDVYTWLETSGPLREDGGFKAELKSEEDIDSFFDGDETIHCMPERSSEFQRGYEEGFHAGFEEGKECQKEKQKRAGFGAASGHSQPKKPSTDKSQP